MKVIVRMTTAMIQIRHVDEQSTHLRLNRVIIAVSVITAVLRQVESIKNHDDAAQVAAVIAVAIHVNLIDRKNIRDGNVNVHRLMIEQVDQAIAATNMTNTQEIKATLEVIATKKVVIE